MKNTKQLSISLVLLGCFAVTSKVWAMNPNVQVERKESKTAKQENNLHIEEDIKRYKEKYLAKVCEMEKQDHLLQKSIYSEINKNIERISKEGLQEKDMIWIIKTLEYRYLSINDLNNLIKFGLKNYVNYFYSDKEIHSSLFYKSPTDTINPFSESFIIQSQSILEAAIISKNLEAVKLLVSIGAKIDKKALETAAKEEKSYKKRTNKEYLIKSTEINKLLLSEKEKQEKAKIEKEKIGKKNF